MKPITVYLDDTHYEKLRQLAMKKAMKNGHRVSVNGVINDAISSYLTKQEIRKEDPPTSKSSEIPSEPLSEQKNNFSFNLNDL